MHGLEVLEQALASGKGVVGITSHLGNWEVLNHFYCNQCKPIIFYRPPKLKAVDDLLREQRVQMGNRVAPSTKEGILSVIRKCAVVVRWVFLPTRSRRSRPGCSCRSWVPRR